MRVLPGMCADARGAAMGVRGRSGGEEDGLTLDVAFLVDGPERGHERGALRCYGRVCVLRGEGRVVREQFLLDRLQLCEVLFFVGGGRCGVLGNKVVAYIISD
jgi:hypothetical protein